MKMQHKYYAIVIGAGVAGIEVAKGLAQAGKDVLLVEKGPFGGQCANFGCIPSKALIASANAAHELWRSGFYGIDMHISNFQATRVLDRVRQVVAQACAKNSSSELNALGIDTYSSVCSFVDPHTVQVNGAGGQPEKVFAKNIIIATGSRPVIPPIKGIDEVPYHTNETIFSLQEIPTSLAIIGGGQIGCEFAQAFRRLGSSVTIIEQQDYLVSSVEPEVTRAIQSVLVKEGVEIYLGNKVERVRVDCERLLLRVRRKSDDKEYDLFVHKLLVAGTRKPLIDKLNLDAARVQYTEAGINHDAYGRTSQPHIWVVGDASGKQFYAHAAINQARTVLSNILLPWPFCKKIDAKQPVPRVIFTDPEVACIGLTESEAIELYGNKSIAVYTVPLAESDRAMCEGRGDGFVKFVTKRFSSKILGASIVAPIAADMLVEIACAMRDGVPLRKLSSLIHPYPTYSQIIHKAAQKWLSDTILPLFGKLFR